MWGPSHAKDADRIVASLIQRAKEHCVYEELTAELSATIDKVIADRPANERVRWALALDAAASNAMRKATGRDRAASVINTIAEVVSGEPDWMQQNTRSYRYSVSGRYTAPPASIVWGIVAQRGAVAIDDASPSDIEFNIKAASASLLRHQKRSLLETIETGIRQEGQRSPWAVCLDALARRAREDRDGFAFWTPSEISLLGALGAEGLIVRWPWIGPLKTHTHAAAERAAIWRELLDLAFDIKGSSKPSKTGMKAFAESAEKIGRKEFIETISSWLQSHPLDPAHPDPDVDLLKVVVWALSAAGAEAALPLGEFAQRCFTKVPQIGARSTKLGNAALTALGLIDPSTAGAGELNRLMQRVRYPSAKQQIAKVLDIAAKRAGLSTIDLEELSVPNFGLDGSRTVKFEAASGTGVLNIGVRSVVELSWRDAKGRSVKSAPAALKASNPETVKLATGQKKALTTALSAQVGRIEGFLAETRTWTVQSWKERYLSHPLLGSIAERLVWQLSRDQDRLATVVPGGDRLLSATGVDVEASDHDRIQLWHPIDSSVDQTIAWRSFLLDRGIVQPFKQAHREIYKLTDAELRSETYSNRFAGHILRQHQMVELAKARGWQASLQGGFDSGTMGPSKAFRSAELEAEYWVNPIGDAERDLSPTGISLRVATDQVRFGPSRPVLARNATWQEHAEALQRRNDRGPTRIADVPPRVFSEAMRDVDLFVSITSLGADPGWTDGGPNGRFGEYWISYANSELSESGISRRETLASLLPRLKIASVCTIEGKHLIVQGMIKRYRIHLGSGTIFMEPDNRYLCIVSGRSEIGGTVALPFEGDTTLSLIISKAVLLADDDKITDPTITRQILG